jgi:ribosome-associated toxin RatA of RatAB toxin-antitoxin module
VADLEGSESLEIDAPIERCFEIAADVERAPDWQGTMRTARAVERDEAGRPVVVESEIDASVAHVTLRLRFSYQEPTGMRWTREAGDLKSLEGSWAFTDLGDGRTRATYSLEIGLNRALGMLAKTVRGPARGHVRHLLAHRPVEGLKRQAESA